MIINGPELESQQDVRLIKSSEHATPSEALKTLERRQEREYFKLDSSAFKMSFEDEDRN